MCSCSVIDNGVIHVTFFDAYRDYITRVNLEKKQEPTLKLSPFKNETINDFKEIIKYYKGDICYSIEPKNSFDNFLKNIKINNLKK